MTPFEGISEFIAVAEAQGFTAAAKRIGVSTSHVSRRVADLEARLGTALVARTTRNVRLTAAGQQYYEHCRELMYGLDEANRSVSAQHLEVSGTLRVSAAGEFVEAHVVPALIEFARMHPRLNVEVDINSRVVDFVEEGIDFSIRYGRLTDSGLVARKLVDRRLVAAASPQYLLTHGTPEHPKELSRHRCLVAATDRWRFELGDGSYEFRAPGRWRSNSGRSIVSACCAGLGIAYMPRSSFGNAFKDGALIPLLEKFGSRDTASWIVYANRQFLPARARLAVDFLLEKFAGWEE